MFVCLCVVCVSKWDSKGKGLYTDMFGVCVCVRVCVLYLYPFCVQLLSVQQVFYGCACFT